MGVLVGAGLVPLCPCSAGLGRPRSVVCPFRSHVLLGNEVIPAAGHANGWYEFWLKRQTVLFLSPRARCGTFLVAKGPSRNVTGKRLS